MSGTTVYAGGRFTTIGGQNRNHIAALDATTGAPAAWNPNAQNELETIAVSGTTVYAGGYFTSIGKGIGHSYFAQFGDFYSAPAVVSVTPSSGINTAAVQITSLSGSNFRSGATVKLTKTGQPDINATGVSVVSSSQITCTVDITNAAPGAWDVVVTNNDLKSGTLAAGFTVALPAAPGVPTLESPADNAANQPLTLTLTWNAVAGAASYRLQVIANDGFSTMVVDDSTITSPSKSVGPLSTSMNYSWRVNAKNNGGTGGWSQVSRFTTGLSTGIKQTALPKSFSFTVSARAGYIRYALPRAEHVFLRLFSIKGQVQSKPVDQQQSAGYYTLSLQRDNVAAGPYLVVFNAGDYHQEKMVFMVK